MKTLLSILLFTSLLQAQDIISVNKGSAKYNWSASTVVRSLTVYDVTLIGKTTLKRNGSGDSEYTLRIRYWSGWDGAKDSTLSPAVLTRIDIPEDTLYYDCTTTQANGRWTEGANGYWVNIPPFYHLVSSTGDTLISSEDDYLVTTP